MTRYGRCMSKKRAKELRKTGQLFDRGNGLVPVFDSPNSVESRIRSMSKDELRAYFRKIGVRDPETIVLFDVEGTPEGTVGPIPQTNGLREYKIPQGTSVEVYGLIRA